MIEKPEEREVVQENALAMIQCKVLKQLEVLQGQKIEDPDITEDIECTRLHYILIFYYVFIL